MLENIFGWEEFQDYYQHRSLRYLLEHKITTPEQQKWIAKLVEFDYEIVYRPGKENTVVDALSRREADSHSLMLALSAPIASIWEEIVAATRADDEIGPLLQQVLDGDQDQKGYEVRHGCLARNARVIVPKGEMRSRLIREFHNSVFGGHYGILRSFKKISQLFDWPGLKKDVKFIQACDVCQRNKADSIRPGLLAPLPIPEQV